MVDGRLATSPGLRMKGKERESERQREGSRREEREHSTIIGLITKLIVILIGQIILFIGINEMITVYNNHNN